MSWQYIYLFILFSSAIISIGIAVYAWNNRHRPGLLYFSGMMLCVAEYTFTSGMMSGSLTPEAANSWVHWHYLGLNFMMALFALYVLQFTGMERWINRNSLIVLFGVPLLTQIIIETNSRHHWFIESLTFERDGILMGLTGIEYGKYFWFHSVYNYILVIACMIMIIRMSLRTFSAYRTQSFILIIAVTIPLLGSINDSRLFIQGFPYPIIPICFAVMGFLLSWNMIRNRMLHLIPVARDALMESMTDLLVVWNTHGQVIDINPAALRMLGKNARDVIGQPLAEVAGPWHGKLSEFRSWMETSGFITLSNNSQEYHFDVRISPIRSRFGNTNGHMIVLRDISKRIEAERQAQRALEKLNSMKQQLYQQSIRDPLTNLYNRRYLEEFIPRELANADRSGYAIGFVMMDIDHFNKINDSYGHTVGDMVLKQLGDYFQSQTRMGDIIFRYGGEEFLVVLINTSAKAACEYAERWRKMIEAHVFLADDQPVRITLSMGVSEYKRDGAALEQVIEDADRALYKAKNAGRNRVEDCGD